MHLQAAADLHPSVWCRRCGGRLPSSTQRSSTAPSRSAAGACSRQRRRKGLDAAACACTQAQGAQTQPQHRGRQPLRDVCVKGVLRAAAQSAPEPRAPSVSRSSQSRTRASPLAAPSMAATLPAPRAQHQRQHHTGSTCLGEARQKAVRHITQAFVAQVYQSCSCAQRKADVVNEAVRPHGCSPASNGRHDWDTAACWPLTTRLKGLAHCCSMPAAAVPGCTPGACMCSGRSHRCASAEGSATERDGAPGAGHPRPWARRSHPCTYVSLVPQATRHRHWHAWRRCPARD